MIFGKKPETAPAYDLSWNSSRLEGDTYSFSKPSSSSKPVVPGDSQLSTEDLMILNHKASIVFLLESTTEAAFHRRTILNLHALLTADLPRDPAS